MKQDRWSFNYWKEMKKSKEVDSVWGNAPGLITKAIIYIFMIAPRRQDQSHWVTNTRRPLPGLARSNDGGVWVHPSKY